MKNKIIYINHNSGDLRNWLKNIGLTPLDYPDEDSRDGLTAPYPDCNGKFYRCGLRFEDDDDYNEFIICNSEEDFKNLVLQCVKNQ